MNNCPICNNKETNELGMPKINNKVLKFIRNNFKVVQCMNCKLYFVDPAIDLTLQEWNSLYEDEYFSQQSNWLLKKREKELTDRLDLLEESLQIKSVNFLDVGCGEGKALIKARSKKWEVTGIDISDNRLDTAKVSEINFRRTNLLEAYFQAEQFDCIYMDSVLEHVLNPMQYLIEIERILKTNGVVYIGVPNEDCLFNDIKQIIFNLKGSKKNTSKISPFNSPYHVIGFNNNSLQYAVNSVGFQIVKMENIGRKFDFLSYKIYSRGFWIRLIFLLPVEFIGALMKRDVYYSLIIKKQ